MNKMTMLELASELACLQSEIVGLKVNNIYQFSPKKIIIKLAKSGLKKHLLIESGVRTHLTDGMSQAVPAKSVFCLKLRKHAKNKTLSAVKQLGADRSAIFSFGYGPGRFHLIFELYGAGNLILADDEYKIVALLRSYETATVKVDVGEHYSLERNVVEPSGEISEKVLKECGLELLEQREKARIATTNAPVGKTGKRRNKRQTKFNVSTLIQRVLKVDTELVVHSLLSLNVDPDTDLSVVLGEDANNSNILEAIVKASNLCLHEMKAFLTGIDNVVGNIAGVKPGAVLINEETGRLEKLLPINFKQFEGMKTVSFKNFDEAVASFYRERETTIEDKIESEKKAHAARVEKVRQTNRERIEALKAKQMSAEAKARTVEANAELVDLCIKGVNDKIAHKADWNELDAFIKAQSKALNPIAMCIDSLSLKERKITLRLRECSSALLFEPGLKPVCHCEDKKSCFELKIPISLNCSARANARAFFIDKKVQKTKEEKTEAASKKAIRTAEKKSLGILKKKKATLKVTLHRTKLWFEKYHWIPTADGHLILAGRDNSQNIMLLTKIIDRQNDFFVGVDNDLDSFVIVKLPPGDLDDQSVSDTLREAGCLAVCKSKLWDDRCIMGPFWVHASKLPPDLSEPPLVSSALKTYLSPQRLEYSVSFLFKTTFRPDVSTPSLFSSNCLNCGRIADKKDHQCKFPANPDLIDESNAEPIFFDWGRFQCFLRSFRKRSEGGDIELVAPVAASTAYFGKGTETSPVVYDIFPGREKRGKAGRAIYEKAVTSAGGKGARAEQLVYTASEREAIEKGMTPNDVISVISKVMVRQKKRACN